MKHEANISYFQQGRRWKRREDLKVQSAQKLADYAANQERLKEDAAL